mgnify:CR=1 FL=1
MVFWLMMETGAANPSARTLDIPEELMGETMRQVITHEIGHALGLQHNMMASSSFPVDSLRSPSFTSKYGVSATIMDYARQNYVAQPGDGLKPVDFIRRLGPFDDFAINWGYRVIPGGNEQATLNGWLTNQSGPFPYRFVPGEFGSLDPRSQTEDMGDDAVKASTYAIANYKRMIPNLIAFNIGVEIGQLLALGGILILMGFWRQSNSFWKHAYLTQVVLMTCGFILMGYQLVGFFLI